MFNSFPTWSLFIIYVIFAAGICFLSKKLADYVDALDKKTKISGAFIGAVLLAAVTSLPELFTSISATILIPESANLVTGNILGSNLFNLAIIGCAMFLFYKKFASSKFEFKTHFIVSAGVFGIYAVIAYGLLCPRSAQLIFGTTGYFSNVNWLTILILVIYAVTIYFQPKESEEDEGEEKVDPYKNITLKQVIIRFIICAIALVACSILITYTTDAISSHLQLDATLAGAIFLAVATSLPELVSTFTLCKKGNFNAALGDIIGSCLFNFLIISISELLSYKVSLLPGGGFTPNGDALTMLFITVFILLFLLGSLIINNKNRKLNKAPSKFEYVTYISSGALLFLGYFVYLIISFTVLK